MTTTEVDRLLAEAYEKYYGRVQESIRAIRAMEMADSRSQAYEPVLEPEPVAAVPRMEVLNLWLDAYQITDPGDSLRRAQLGKLLSTIPGKVFCDARYILSSIEEIMQDGEGGTLIPTLETVVA